MLASAGAAAVPGECCAGAGAPPLGGAIAGASAKAGAGADAGDAPARQSAAGASALAGAGASAGAAARASLKGSEGGEGSAVGATRVSPVAAGASSACDACERARGKSARETAKLSLAKEGGAPTRRARAYSRREGRAGRVRPRAPLAPPRARGFGGCCVWGTHTHLEWWLASSAIGRHHRVVGFFAARGRNLHGLLSHAGRARGFRPRRQRARP